MQTIFYSSIAVVLIAVIFATSSCKKDESPEEALRITTDAAAMTLTPGPEYEFTLTVESVMPAAGVRIQLTLKGEADNQNYPQGLALETTTTTTRIKISNLPRQKICVCTVLVASKSSGINSATTSFRVAYK